MQLHGVIDCMQAWGLLELQEGNALGAVKLLQRGVQLDPSLAAVLRWQPFQDALLATQQARSARQKIAQSLQSDSSSQRA